MNICKWPLSALDWDTISSMLIQILDNRRHYACQIKSNLTSGNYDYSCSSWVTQDSQVFKSYRPYVDEDTKIFYDEDVKNDANAEVSEEIEYGLFRET